MRRESAEVPGKDQPRTVDYTGEIIKKRRVRGWLYKREMETGLTNGLMRRQPPNEKPLRNFVTFILEQ